MDAEQLCWKASILKVAALTLITSHTNLAMSETKAMNSCSWKVTG